METIIESSITVEDSREIGILYKVKHLRVSDIAEQKNIPEIVVVDVLKRLGLWPVKYTPKKFYVFLRNLDKLDRKYCGHSDTKGELMYAMICLRCGEIIGSEHTHGALTTKSNGTRGF